MRTKQSPTQDRKKAFLNEFGGPQQWGKYKDVVWTVIMMAAENTLTWREQEILRGIMSLRSFEELAVVFGVSPERIRHIFHLALRRVLRFRHVITEGMEAAQEEIKQLKVENDRLKNEVFRLQNPELKDVHDVDYALYRYGQPFTTKVGDCYFSVRLLNCLQHNQIHTIGDIVSFKRQEYMKLRNFGKKTLDELDSFLESKRLTYGMWTNPDRPKIYQ